MKAPLEEDTMGLCDVAILGGAGLAILFVTAMDAAAVAGVLAVRLLPVHVQVDDIVCTTVLHALVLSGRASEYRAIRTQCTSVLPTSLPPLPLEILFATQKEAQLKNLGSKFLLERFDTSLRFVLCIPYHLLTFLFRRSP